jgi:5-methylcytosine-specific restriction endonuclease McrA
MPSLNPITGRRPNGRGSKWITPQRRLAIYIRDGFTCCYCGRNLKDADRREVTLDHLTPKADGGTHASTNLITACGKCNFRRQDRPWRAFIRANNSALMAAHLIDMVTLLRNRKPNVELAKAIIAGRTPAQEINR